MIVSDTYFADWVQENIVVNNFITLPSETIFPILAIHSELMPLGHLAILMGAPMIWTANASLTKINLRCLISLRTLTCGHKAVHNNNNVCFFNRTFNYVCYQRISCCKKHGAVHLVTQGKILIFVTLVQLQMVSDFSKTTKCSPMGFCTFVGLWQIYIMLIYRLEIKWLPILNITGLKIPSSKRQTSWLFTNMIGDLSVWSGQKLNVGPPDYKSGGLTTWLYFDTNLSIFHM